MNDVQRLVVPGMLGFLLGILTEKAKLKLQERLKLKNLRLAIYREIARNFLACTKGEFWKLKTDTYDSLRKDPISFYGIPEINWIEEVYRTLGDISQRAEQDPTDNSLRFVKSIEYTIATTKMRRGRLLLMIEAVSEPHSIGRVHTIRYRISLLRRHNYYF